jgi:hypothetical protein
MERMMPQLLLTEDQLEDLSMLADCMLEHEYTDFREQMCETGCLKEYPGLTEEEQDELQTGSRFSERTVELIRKAAMCRQNMHPYAIAYRTNEWICAYQVAQVTGKPLLMEQYQEQTNG